jgi:hypothetical protein
MRIERYEFRPGMVFQAGAKPDAKVVGTTLEELRQQFKGEITPEDVVEAARSLNNPLHPYFQWDDSKAAQEHRLAQARSLIRSVVAIYRDPKISKEPVRMVAFTHIRDGEASHYRDTSEAMRVKTTRAAILKRAWDELKQWRRRYQTLREFADLFDAIDDLEDDWPPEK